MRTVAFVRLVSRPSTCAVYWLVSVSSTSSAFAMASLAACTAVVRGQDLLIGRVEVNVVNCVIRRLERGHDYARLIRTPGHDCGRTEAGLEAVDLCGVHARVVDSAARVRVRVRDGFPDRLDRRPGGYRRSLDLRIGRAIDIHQRNRLLRVRDRVRDGFLLLFSKQRLVFAFRS